MAENSGALKALNIPLFYGEIGKDSLSAKSWTRQVQSCMKLSGWDSAKTANFACLTLRGTAGIWANSKQELDSTVFNTWENLQKEFLNRFHIKKTLAELSYLKSTLVQAEKELVRDFWDRCVSAQLLFDETWGELAAEAPADEKTAYEKAKKESHTKSVQLNFIVGVHTAIRSRLVIEQCKTSEDLLDLAQRVEASIRDEKKIFTDTSKLEIAGIKGQPPHRGQNPNRARGFRARGRGNGGGNSSHLKNGSCYKCGDPGHWANLCPQKGVPNIRGRGNYFRGARGSTWRGRGQNFNANTASIHMNGNVGENNSNEETQQQQQQQQQQQEEEDPYAQLTSSMITLNPLAH